MVTKGFLIWTTYGDLNLTILKDEGSVDNSEFGGGHGWMDGWTVPEREGALLCKVSPKLCAHRRGLNIFPCF